MPQEKLRELKRYLGVKSRSPRMRFIKCSIFDGLNDYETAPSIEVIRKKINYNFKLELAVSSAHGLRVKSGGFYQKFSQGIYGGELEKMVELFEDDPNFSLKFQPDISSEKFDREIKSVSIGRYIRLEDRQVAKHFMLKLLKKSKEEQTYEIFRHGIYRLERDFVTKSTEDLLEKLTKSTRFMISLPFRIILDLYASRLFGEYQEQEKSCRTYVRLDSGPLNFLLAYPEETLKYFNVELDGLKFIKSKLPSRMTLNGFKISPFPILIVKDSGSEKWEQRF